MRNVPKIVAERLRAATPAAQHPDANLLTAFAEHSLSERERGAVLEHLARCGDCREVVALVLPASEDLQKVFVPARGWLTWPVLRWGFVTVGIIAIAGVGFLQVQKRQELKQTARVEPYASPKEAGSAVPSAAPAENNEKTPANTAADKAGRVAAQNIPAASAPAPSPALRVFAPAVSVPVTSGVAGGVVSRTVHTQFPHGPLPPAQWQQQTRMSAVPSAAAKQQAAGQAVNPPAASETVEVEAAPVQMQAQTTNQDVQLQAKSEPPAVGYTTVGPVAKSKPAVTAVGANAAAQGSVVVATGQPPSSQGVIVTTDQPTGPQAIPLNVRNFTQLVTLAPATTPRWTISPSGTLQRSFDQGKTWQDVDVNANAGFGQNYDYTTSVQVLPAAPAKDAQANKKTPRRPSSTYVLRAVASNGPEVWVGYSQGLLLHSVDVGAHWTYVWPMAGGANLTGDIVALEFADVQHGKVTTSTGELWITADDGQSWQKQ